MQNAGPAGQRRIAAPLALLRALGQPACPPHVNSPMHQPLAKSCCPQLLVRVALASAGDAPSAPAIGDAAVAATL